METLLINEIKKECVELRECSVKISTINVTDYLLEIYKHEPELTIIDDASLAPSSYNSNVPSTSMDASATRREDSIDISKPKGTHLQQKKRKYSEPPAQCKICSKMFSRASVMKLHLETHNRDRHHFECDVCSKKITTRHAFISHFRTAHGADKAYECKSCQKKFATKKSFQKHSNTHTALRKFKCLVCLQAFKEKSVLKTHMKKHVRQPVTCKLCGRVFETQNWLDFHLRSTNHNKTYSCDICGKTFRSRNVIKGHFITHQTEEKFECKICSRKFKHPKRLREHMLRLKHTDPSHVTFKCIVCPEVFTSKNALDEHFTIHFDGKHFTCTLCPKKYSCANHLKRHSLEKHIKPNTRFKCELCSQTFQHEVTLKTHLENHISTPSVVHKCGYCAKTFAKPTDRRVHEVSHKPLLKCDFCYKSFRLQILMDKHSEIHDEILYGESTGTGGTYHCDICSTVCSTKIGIWKHLKSHTQSLQCEFCFKCFDKFEPKFRSHLNAHIAKAMNKNKNYRCESCPMEFDNKISLEDHVLGHHKSKLYKSKYCTNRFGNRFRWAKHNEEHENKQRKECKECTQCIRATYYTKHEQMHAAGKQPYSKYIATFWTCNFCDASVTTNNDLRNHLANDHQMEFPIPVWKWRCDVCGDEMALHGLVKHLRKVHGQEFSTATKKWKCIDCSIDCLTYGGVWKHMKKFHAERMLSSKKDTV